MNGAGSVNVAGTAESMTHFFSEETVPMFRFRKYLALLAVLVGAAILWAPTQAHAAFKLRVTDVTGAVSKTVTDNDIGPPADADPASGALTFILTVGDFKVTATGTSKPFLANSTTTAELDLLGIAVVKTGGTGGGTVRIELTDTDYDLTPAAAGLAVLTSTIGGTGTVGSVVSAKQMVQLGAGAGTEFGTSPIITLVNAPPALGPGAFSDTKSGTFAYTGGKFSITEFDEVFLPTVGSSVSFDHDSLVRPVPAPAGLILVGTGGLSFLGYRLRRKKVIA